MLLILICSTVLIVIVNPRGLYGVSLFPQLHDNIRQEKVGYYLNLPEVPEMVIIGTSAALSISPEYIENTLGYNTFNFGISGPELDDSLLITRFIFDHSDSQNPKLILFQARGLARIDPKRMAQVSPLLFIPYMEPELRMLAFEIRFQELFNIHQLSEAIYVLQAIQNYEELPSYWSVTPNGFTEFHPPFTLEDDINKYLASGRPEISCRDENIMRGKIYLREIVSIAEENDAAIILFYNPIHPFFYQQYFENNPKSVRCFNIGKEFLLSLEAEYKHVFFEDFNKIESMFIFSL
jgi:hypothetical protein